MVKLRRRDMTEYELLAYDGANFAYSEIHRTSAGIISQRPFFHRWNSDNNLEVLTFDNPSDPETAKLFHFYLESLADGQVDLERTEPAAAGQRAIEILRRYSASRRTG